MTELNLLNKLSSFLLTTRNVSIDDDFYKCKAIYSAMDNNIADDYSDEFDEVIRESNKLSLRFDVTYKIKDSDDILISSGTSQASFEDKVKNLKDNIYWSSQSGNDALDNEVIIEVVIYKDSAINKDNVNYIFDFNSFFNDKNIANELDFLFKLKEFNVNKNIYFLLFDGDFEFNTKSIHFIKPSKHIDSNDSLIERGSFINKRNKSCHFTNDSEFKFTPCDFYLLNECKVDRVKKIFDRLLVVFSLVYLSDYSDLNLNKNEIIYKFKGYRLINGAIDISNIENNSEYVIFDIYSWVYTDGNFIDKLGLARNIISLYIKGNDIMTLPINALKSVESGYDIYLKENVKQYIEIKNKISEFLISQSDKASEITKSMFSSLKSSLWSIVTFFVSVVLIRMVSSQSYTGIVTIEILIITIVFVFFSFLYLCLSIKEVNEEKERLLNKYDAIRNRYKDLLNESDLDNIIDTINLKQKDSSYIEGRKKDYRRTWIIFNLSVVVVVLFLYFYMNHNVIDSIVYFFSDFLPAKISSLLHNFCSTQNTA